MSDQSDLHDNLPYFEETKPEYTPISENLDIPINWEKLMDWATD